MSDQRECGIAWTDATWNPLRGCSKVSAGCKHCYAETMAARFSAPGQPYEGTIERGRWSGQIRLVPEKLAEPLHWKRPRRIFVNSMSDLFHEGVPFEFVAAVFGVMAACPQHVFQVLTKRPERATEFFKWASILHAAEETHIADICEEFSRGAGVCVDPKYGLVEWPLPNVWLGVSVEDQTTADLRIPLLLQCPAAVRWVSYEPALWPVDFTRLILVQADPPYGPGVHLNALTGHVAGPDDMVPRVSWVVVGGESGPNARPFNVAWARSTIAQCRAAGVACFVKQMGARPRVAEASRLAALWAAMPGGRVDDCGGIHLRDRAGADPAEWPEDLRVREWPAAKEGEK